jgi:hypothetical protein
MGILLWIKANIKIFGFWLLSFILPIKPLLVIIGLAIAVDTIMGIWAARKQGKKITSYRMADSIKKVLMYNMVIISFYYLDVHLLSEFTKIFFPSMDLLLTKLLAMVLTSIEGFSIDEKFKIITGEGIFERFMKLLKGFKGLKRKIDE